MKKWELIKKFREHEFSDEQKDLIKNVADGYEDKSDDEIFVEIIELNAKMEEELSHEEYENLFDKIESIRPLLSDEQNEKLNRILDVLNKDK